MKGKKKKIWRNGGGNQEHKVKQIHLRQANLWAVGFKENKVSFSNNEKLENKLKESVLYENDQ